MKITAAKIAEWYATRDRLGGSDILTRDEASLLRRAHYDRFGLIGGSRLTVRMVREYVETEGAGA